MREMIKVKKPSPGFRVLNYVLKDSVTMKVK